MDFLASNIPVSFFNQVIQVSNLIRKRPLQRCEAALGTNKKHRALADTLQLKHFSQYKKQRKLFPNAKNNSFTCVKVDEFSKKTDVS